MYNTHQTPEELKAEAARIKEIQDPTLASSIIDDNEIEEDTKKDADTDACTKTNSPN